MVHVSVDFLVISKNGASGDYPGCTDLAYEKAIKDGADVIHCSVQMSSEGKPFCSSSIDLEKSTMVSQTFLSNRSIIIPEISSDPGIYTFSLTWPEIQSLTRKFPHLAYSYLKYLFSGNFTLSELDMFFLCSCDYEPLQVIQYVQESK